MQRRRAAKTRTEFTEIWEQEPGLSSKEVVGEFKRRHGSTPAFDLTDIIDYGLMEIAGQIARRPLIDEDQGDLFPALLSNPDRKNLKRTMPIRVRRADVEVDMKLDLISLRPSEFFSMEIVDRQPRPRSPSSALDILKKDMELMRAAGDEEMTYGEFLRKGG